jgi:hypothetical protein
MANPILSGVAANAGTANSETLAAEALSRLLRLRFMTTSVFAEISIARSRCSRFVKALPEPWEVIELFGRIKVARD